MTALELQLVYKLSARIDVNSVARWQITCRQDASISALYSYCVRLYQYINAMGFYNARRRGHPVISSIISPFICLVLLHTDRITILWTRITPACSSLLSADAPLCNRILFSAFRCVYALYCACHCNHISACALATHRLPFALHCRRWQDIIPKFVSVYHIIATCTSCNSFARESDSLIILRILFRQS